MKHCRIRLWLPFVILVAAGCRGGESASDAFGNFEADRTTISSEAAGTLVAFRVREGERLPAGRVVAVVDTTQLVLERAALRAQRRAVRSRISGVRSQLDVLAEKRDIAQRERQRFENLVRRDAAARKQLDEVEDQFRLVEREMAPMRSQVATIENEIEAIDAQLAQIADRLDRHVVVNPVDGTVLTVFAEPYELAAPGRPLYAIADLDTLVLKAYVSGAQLPGVRLRERVDVVVDRAGGGLRTLTGRVSRIADEAEFTPRLIQTREERVDLVYAVDVRVANPDGTLKIGMPGEVRFREIRAADSGAED